MNRHKQHIYVLPEDRANERIVNGFIGEVPHASPIEVGRPAGGWENVRDKFVDVLAPEMRQFPKMMTVLLIDFDEKAKRLSDVQHKIPIDLTERVFVLGTFSNPEKLKTTLKLSLSFEEIGETLAQECADQRNELWGHALLKHNQPELERMIKWVKPWLFKSV